MTKPRKTPGVYIQEELEANPPTVVGVATAVPVFIGYTETASFNGNDLQYMPTLITSMTEYYSYYGYAYQANFTLTPTTTTTDADITLGGTAYQVQLADDNTAYFYNSIQLFYANGGGACYILSVGTYGGKDSLQINIDDFIGTKNVFNILENIPQPTLVVLPDIIALGAAAYPVYTAALQHCANMQSRFAILDVAQASTIQQMDIVVDEFKNAIGNTALNYGAAYFPFLQTSVVPATQLSAANFDASVNFNSLAVADQQQLCSLAAQQLNILPPSGAMAGIYTMVDNQRGVWKAPANVAVTKAIAPLIDLNADQQGTLNAPLDGKAINVIRTFPEIGTLVWGARTLDSNSQDWRYINVRRTLIMIEQSLKQGLNGYIFSANVAQTWVLIKASFENFLNSLWKEGALAGSTPAEAYQVQVGLGTTMTSDDILNNILRVTISVAIVRPAEFITITLQQQQP